MIGRQVIHIAAYPNKNIARCFNNQIISFIKLGLMQTNLTLDEMILQYSESPFIDDETFNDPAITNRSQKQKILSKLLLIAGNLFERYPESNLSFYKRRYEFK